MRFCIHFYITTLKFLVVISSAFFASSALFADRIVPEQTMSGGIRWGSCRMAPGKQADGSPPPGTEVKWPILCVRSKLTSQILFRDDSGHENVAYHLGRIYQGLHFSDHFSLHGDFQASRLIYVGTSKEDHEAVQNFRETKALFLQYGNPATSRYRAALGRIDPVFGINHQPLPEVFDATLKTQRYWEAPDLGLRLTYDSLVSSVFDVSVHADPVKNDGAKMHPNKDANKDAALAARMMFDIAAMDGFRFVVSGYGARNGERRFGGGAVNRSSRGDFTTFEWVRASKAVNLTNSEFEQNFRLNFTSAFRGDTRWLFDFESERTNFRMGTIGFDTNIPDYGMFRLTGTIHNGWQRRTNQFFMITSAIQVAL